MSFIPGSICPEEVTDMIKDYRLLLVLTVVAVAAFGLSLMREARPEYAKLQKAYYKELGVDDYSIEIKQINVKTPSGVMVDRCMSCHIGAMNPDASGLEPALRTHSRIAGGTGKDPHDFTKTGCAVCHEGNGRALAKKDAHGELHGWIKPQLAGELAQASCSKCHDMAGKELPGAELYEKGRQLFVQKACWGCHTIDGVSTGTSAPELTDAGAKFTYDYLVESMLDPTANTDVSLMPRFNWVDDFDKVKALAVYLKGQRKDQLRDAQSAPIGFKGAKVEYAVIDHPTIEAGKAIFLGWKLDGKVVKGGCVSCHSYRDDGGVLTGGLVCPELTYVAKARSKKYIEEHIRNSRQHVMDSIMPLFKDFTVTEVQSVIAFLADLKYQPPGKLSGKHLFETYCILCHGEKLDGRGQVSAMLDPLPRDLSRHQFIASYEERFKESIKNGVVGTAMAAWKDVLGEEEINKLIGYITEQSKADAKKFVRYDVALPKPGDPERRDYRGRNMALTTGDAERGKAAFQKFCASCHGKLANGKGPNAYGLEHPLPRNLINRQFLNQPAVTDERLYRSILLGVPGTPMPSHDHLTDQTILDAIAFIRGNTEEQESTDEK